MDRLSNSDHYFSQWGNFVMLLQPGDVFKQSLVSPRSVSYGAETVDGLKIVQRIN